MNTREIIQRRLRPEGDGLNRTVCPRNDVGRRRRLAAGAISVVVLVVALPVLGPLGGGEGAKPGEGRRGIRSTTVKRQTLVERESVEGTLGYSGARAVVNRLAAGDGESGGGSSGSGDGADGGGGSTGSGGGSNGGGGGSGAGGGSAMASGSEGGTIAAQNASLSGAQAQDDGTGDEKGGAENGGEKKGAAEKSESDKKRSRQDGLSHGRGAEAQGGRGRDGNGVAGSNSGGGGRGADSRSSGGQNKPSTGGGSTSSGANGRATSQGSGTVTRLAREGSIAGRGQTLYELDNGPVVLMYGSVPAYRGLSTATTAGPDVRQLERNLVALGFGAGVTVDEQFTAATAAAVRRWQRSLGLPQTGAVELGRVVFLPGARRIGSHKVKLGSVAATGAEVLETSSARRVVSVELDVAKQGLVKRGDKVTVTLPDGTTVSGRITEVGRVAHKKDEGDRGTGGGDGAPGGSGSGSGELVIDVSIVLQSHRGVSRLDQAPVTVGIAQETRRSVLAVPVSALVARVGGGYGVEVLRGGRRRIVPVRTGLFADGLVEISARGIAEGTKVAIPEEA